MRGQGKAVPRLVIRDQVEVGVLCGLELAHESVCRLPDDVLEEGRLVRVVAIERALREAGLGDDPVQGGILEALFEKLPLPDLQDLCLGFRSVHSSPVHGLVHSCRAGAYTLAIPYIPAVYTTSIYLASRLSCRI